MKRAVASSKAASSGEVLIKPVELRSVDDVDYADDDVVTMKPSALDICRNATLRKMTLILCFAWFAATCIYYGLSLNVTTLTGSPYVNFFLNGAVEIPANFGAVYFLSRFGRRFTISSANLICGVSLLLMMFVPDENKDLYRVLYLVGKFGITATFSCIYLYTTELYPTLLRGNGIGICSSCARVGAVISQAINILSVYAHSAPYIVYGCIAMIAAFLILLLPETMGYPLPDTISASEQLYRERRLKMFTKGSKIPITSNNTV